MILRSDYSEEGCSISSGKKALKHLVIFSCLTTRCIHADVPKQCFQSLYCQKLQASVHILVMSHLTISLWHPLKHCPDKPVQLIRASVSSCSVRVPHDQKLSLSWSMCSGADSYWCFPPPAAKRLTTVAVREYLSAVITYLNIARS